MIINYGKYKPSQGFACTEPSLTLPDETMSMRTILDRFARGLPVQGTSQPILEYDEERVYTDPRDLDLSEIEDLSIQHEKLLRDAKNWQKDATKSKIEADAVEAYKKALAKEQESKTPEA